MDLRPQPPRRSRELLLGALAFGVLAATARGDAGFVDAVQSALPGVPPELVRRLVDEKVVLLASSGDSEPPPVEGLVLFAKPRARVLQLLLQTARQIEYRPDLARLETVERLPDGDVDVQEMRIMLMHISYWLRYQWDVPAGRISWKLDPRFPNDLRVTEGFWELHEVDSEHSVARFGTRVDVGPALPSFLQEIATRKNLPLTLERCRRWVDSDGTYRP
jgi:hypothetical protein